MATPSITSSNACRGRSNGAMNGCRRAPCVVSRRAALEARARAPRARRRSRRARSAHRRSIGAILIHRIVDRAAEVPDRDDGAALLGRKDEERIVETGLARHHAPRRPAHRAPEQQRHVARRRAVGRTVNSSRRVRSTRSRIRVPPSQVRRSSKRRRPRTPSHTARPASNCSVVTAMQLRDRRGPRGRQRTGRRVREIALAGAASPGARRAARRPGRCASRGRSPARNS